MKEVKVKTKKDDMDNQVIENNIKINIDMKDLEALKPEKKKKQNKRSKKPKELLDPYKGNATPSSSTIAPRKLGTKIPSTDTDFNPNNTTNTIISTALQTAMGNRPNFLFGPTQPPLLPPPEQRYTLQELQNIALLMQQNQGLLAPAPPGNTAFVQHLNAAGNPVGRPPAAVAAGIAAAAARGANIRAARAAGTPATP